MCDCASRLGAGGTQSRDKIAMFAGGIRCSCSLQKIKLHIRSVRMPAILLLCGHVRGHAPIFRAGSACAVLVGHESASCDRGGRGKCHSLLAGPLAKPGRATRHVLRAPWHAPLLLTRRQHPLRGFYGLCCPKPYVRAWASQGRATMPRGIPHCFLKNIILCAS